MIDKTERCVYIITDEVPVEEYGKTYRKQWMEKYRIKDDYYFNIPSGLKLEIKTVAIGVLQDGYAPLCNGDLVIVFNHSFCAERVNGKIDFVEYETCFCDPEYLFMCEDTVFVADDWYDAHERCVGYEGPILHYEGGFWDCESDPVVDPEFADEEDEEK